MTKKYQRVQFLVELAALAAYHGDAFLRATTGASRSGVESYWLASRNRLDAWATALKRLEVRAGTPGSGASGHDDTCNTLLPLVEEILASEVLTRIWTAIGCAIDERQDTQDVGPFVRSVLVGHLEVRHRALRLAFHKLTLPSFRLQQIDRIRRRAERWTDVLLGYLVRCSRVAEFAFDTDRVLDFASSLDGQSLRSQDLTQSLLMASLRSTFQSGFSDRCPNPLYNSQVCEAVLACFGSDVFDSTGQFRSLWELRLRRAARDTEGMLQCLAAEHEPCRACHPPISRNSRRGPL